MTNIDLFASGSDFRGGKRRASDNGRRSRDQVLRAAVRPRRHCDRVISIYLHTNKHSIQPCNAFYTSVQSNDSFPISVPAIIQMNSNGLKWVKFNEIDLQSPPITYQVQILAKNQKNISNSIASSNSNELKLIKMNLNWLKWIKMDLNEWKLI